MYQREYNGINSFLVNTAKLLLAEGKKRIVRNEECYELTEPYMFKIKNPLAREITINERNWNKSLAYAESLWIATGRNDLEYIKHYLERMKEFSDDGIFLRGGYGPRLRHYNGDKDDYKFSGYTLKEGVDMFRYVVDCFQEDSNTRRAIITLGDNNKDCFDENGKLKNTKDIPCTRELHFIKQSENDKLDLVVHMRSNDFIWGASAVNVFNYTYMQEYMSAILGLDIGNYYHIVDNFHYYSWHKDLVETLASINKYEEKPLCLKKTFDSLGSFDSLLKKLSIEENKMRTEKNFYREIHFEDPFFDNWYNVLLDFNFAKCA